MIPGNDARDGSSGDVDAEEEEEEAVQRGGRQGSGRQSVPLSTYGPQGYGLEVVRGEAGRQGSVRGTGVRGAGVKDDGKWRAYGRYGRTVDYVAAQVMLLDARGLQAQGTNSQTYSMEGLYLVNTLRH